MDFIYGRAEKSVDIVNWFRLSDVRLHTIALYSISRKN